MQGWMGISYEACVCRPGGGKGVSDEPLGLPWALARAGIDQTWAAKASIGRGRRMGKFSLVNNDPAARI